MQRKAFHIFCSGSWVPVCHTSLEVAEMVTNSGSLATECEGEGSGCRKGPRGGPSGAPLGLHRHAPWGSDQTGGKPTCSRAPPGPEWGSWHLPPPDGEAAAPSLSVTGSEDSESQCVLGTSTHAHTPVSSAITPESHACPSPPSLRRHPAIYAGTRGPSVLGLVTVRHSSWLRYVVDTKKDRNGAQFSDDTSSVCTCGTRHTHRHQFTSSVPLEVGGGHLRAGLCECECA